MPCAGAARFRREHLKLLFRSIIGRMQSYVHAIACGCHYPQTTLSMLFHVDDETRSSKQLSQCHE
jgi:hypothetical protein